MEMYGDYGCGKGKVVVEIIYSTKYVLREVFNK